MIKNIKELQKVYKEKFLLKKKNKKIKNLKDLNVFFNVLKNFSSLRFFKIKKYPFGRFLYLSNSYLRIILYTFYFLHFSKGLCFFFKKLLKIKIFKKEGKLLLKFFKRWERKIIIIRIFYIKRLKSFFENKFKYKKLKKKMFLEKRRKFFKKKIIKTKEQLLLEEEKAIFAEHISENINSFKAKRHSLKYKVKKVTKKQFSFVKKRKIKKDKLSILKRLAFMLTYRIEKIRKGQKKKKGEKRIRPKITIHPSHKIKGTFKERKEAGQKLYKSFYENEKKIKRFLKKRKRNLWRKSFLIKKYKRIIYRRKKRTGILHFRKYYSNYYITLTDLSHNVIFTCSAGAVSTGRNKKTKMSNAVAMPIFYRIAFFLRKFKIRSLKFIFRTRMDKMVFIAVNYFKKRHYRIKTYSIVYKAPHHLGQRKQKPRRI